MIILVASQHKLTTLCPSLGLTHVQGYRHMVLSNTTSRPPQPSLFESPMYERSYKDHAVCVRFRYLVYGPGKRFLRLYQQLDLLNHTSSLMWAVNESNNTEVVWKYGRVAVPSVSKYKVRKRLLSQL